MNESTEQTPPFNPSGAMPVSPNTGLMSIPQTKTNPPIVNEWYWITYSYTKTRWTKNWIDKQSVEEIELAKCKAIRGDCGLFETNEVGLNWIHHTRCVSQDNGLKKPEGAKEGKGFFKRLFGL